MPPCNPCSFATKPFRGFCVSWIEKGKATAADNNSLWEFCVQIKCSVFKCLNFNFPRMHYTVYVRERCRNLWNSTASQRDQRLMNCSLHQKRLPNLIFIMIECISISFCHCVNLLSLEEAIVFHLLELVGVKVTAHLSWKWLQNWMKFVKTCTSPSHENWAVVWRRNF